ncbi:MAG TPA: tandem-95 repeat protein, partial [Actinomycetota bacterium]|nr:tandem-95 repeat protein [Actinomycetota bacterium]
FKFVAHDGTTQSPEATVTITVSPQNDGPDADNQSPSTDEDTPLLVTLTGSDVDGDSFTFRITALPADGKLYEGDSTNPADEITAADLVLGVGSHTIPANQVTYAPNADFNGGDSFKFVAHDGTTQSPEATVTITVSPQNDGPDAADDSDATNEDTAVNTDVLANDTDIDGDTLTVTAASDPANGTTTVEADDTITYTPDADFNGSDTYTYDVSDGNGGTDTATVTIAVAPVDDGGSPGGGPTPLPTPVAPSGLIATATGPGTVELSWTDNSATEDDFHVERTTTPGDAASWTEVLTDPVSPATDTGLSCDTTYSYRVRAHRHSDNAFSPYSNVADSTTDTCTDVDPPPPATAPAVSSMDVSSSVFSPNGDGKLDELVVSASMSEVANWEFSVAPEITAFLAGAAPIYSVSGEGTSMTESWDGRTSSGDVAPDGTYVWTLTATNRRGVEMTPATGQIEIDTTAPVLLGIKALPARFELRRDDATAIVFSTTEAARGRVRIVKNGKVVKRLGRYSIPRPGKVDFLWSGRNSRGRRVAPGRYTVVIGSIDAAFNRTTNRGLRIRVVR